MVRKILLNILIIIPYKLRNNYIYLYRLRDQLLNFYLKLYQFNNKMNRPSWTEYFRDLVKLTATRSSCARLHVGCILILENRIIAQGYNGFLAGCPHESCIQYGHEMATVHAEQNAIADCAKRGVSCNNCQAYITHYPCLTCTKMLLAAGITEIFYIDNYNNDQLVAKFCEQMNCKIVQI